MHIYIYIYIFIQQINKTSPEGANEAHGGHGEAPRRLPRGDPLTLYIYIYIYTHLIYINKIMMIIIIITLIIIINSCLILILLLLLLIILLLLLIFLHFSTAVCSPRRLPRGDPPRFSAASADQGYGQSKRGLSKIHVFWRNMHLLLSAVYHASVAFVRSDDLYNFCCAQIYSAHITVEATAVIYVYRHIITATVYSECVI